VSSFKSANGNCCRNFSSHAVRAAV
jgi:hypothetical protein